MEQTPRVITLWLRRHPKYEHTFAIFGDPETTLAAQLERVPFGARVRLVVTPFGADPPSSYSYAWYGLRPDIRWEWSGHLNAWGYELAAKHQNGVCV
jgi:hypothetical protein